MEKDTLSGKEVEFLNMYSDEVAKLRGYGVLAKEVVGKHLAEKSKPLALRMREALAELQTDHQVPLKSDINGPYYEGIRPGGPMKIRMAETNNPEYNHIELEDGEEVAIEYGKVVRLNVGGKYRPIEDCYELTVYYDWGFADQDQQAGLERDRRTHRYD